MLEKRDLTRVIALIIVSLLGAAAPATATLPGTDILVPAAARGEGNEGSLWLTSLHVTNLATESTDITCYWLVRNQANLAPPWSAFTLEPGESVFFEDVISDLFHLDAAEGALRLVATNDVIVLAAILNRAGGSEYGQGFEGIPVVAATPADSSAVVPGIIHSATHRSNLFLVDATGTGSTVIVEALDNLGQIRASRSYTLGAWEPRLTSLDRFGNPTLVGGALRINVTSGAVIAGASRVNRSSGDPVTLGASWQAPSLQGWAPPSLVGKRFIFSVYDSIDGIVESDVAFLTGTTGTATTPDDGEMELTYHDYTPIGSLATLYYTVPGLEISEMHLLMTWDSPTTGFFTGTADDPDQPMVAAGTFEEIE